jgi:hypothetical protein
MMADIPPRLNEMIIIIFHANTLHLLYLYIYLPIYLFIIYILSLSNSFHHNIYILSINLFIIYQCIHYLFIFLSSYLPFYLPTYLFHHHSFFMNRGPKRVLRAAAPADPGGCGGGGEGQTWELDRPLHLLRPARTVLCHLLPAHEAIPPLLVAKQSVICLS